MKRGNRFATLMLMLLAAGCGLRHNPPPMLEIDPAQPPEATLDTPYAEPFTVQGHQAPLARVKKLSGQWPPGLELRWSEGDDHFTLEGTPEETGEWEAELLVSTFDDEGVGQEMTQRMRFRVQP